MPDTVETILADSIAYSKLQIINIPATVLNIEDYALCCNYDLLEINVASDNPNYSSVNGILYNKDQTTLINYPVAKTDTEFTVPDSVESIGVGAFISENGSSLKITVPGTVTTIGSNAFKNVPLVIYDGEATGSPWGALKVAKSDGTVIYPAE